MRVRACLVALGLGALAGTPASALTVQHAPPRPDVAQRLRPAKAPEPSVLPAPGDLQGSFLAPGRPQLGQGLSSPAGTTSFGFGPLRATTTITPDYGASRFDTGPRNAGNPLSLTLPRR